jgi:transaldolase
VRIHSAIARAEARQADLARLGISLAEVTARLEVEGVSKFAASYESLLRGIEAKMEALALR